MGVYKLVALDMDGTLLNREGLISHENKRAIYAATAAGVTVVLSTGRGLPNIMPYAEELRLDAPIVAVNGGEIWKKPRQLWKRELLDSELVVRMRDIALRHDSWYWGYSVNGGFNKLTWPKRPIRQMQWMKFGYYNEDAELLASIRRELEGWGTLEITNSHPFNLEINPKGVNKASGLHKVCGFLGLDMSQAVAMGDSLNDIAMIRAAGLGVAMGNAQDEVKRAADLVAASNEEDGVAKVIWERVLKQ